MSAHIKRIDVCHIKGAENKLDELISWLSISKNTAKKFLAKKDLLEKIQEKEELVLPLNLINMGKINPEYHGEEVKILFEDENLLALNKPVKIHMHPLCYDEHDNLLSFLRQNRKDELLDVNKKNYDRGLLFRLDYETSGVCLYAKNDELYERVRQNFSVVAKKKEYFAIVRGEFPSEMELSDHMGVSGIKNQKMKNNQNGELAHLKATRLDYRSDKELSLLKIDLVTGLRHQIRFQLSNAGFPILGESLYAQDFLEKRLYLHAFTYELKLDQNKTYNICAPIPKLFKDFFDFD